jgi:hypothetical protein
LGREGEHPFLGAVQALAEIFQRLAAYLLRPIRKLPLTGELVLEPPRPRLGCFKAHPQHSQLRSTLFRDRSESFPNFPRGWLWLFH